MNLTQSLENIDTSGPNLLKFVPVRHIKYITDPETNLIVIKKPKFTNRYLKKHLLPVLSNKDFSIKLDQYGSHVWNAIDGERDIQQIAEHLKKTYGESVEPVYERVGKFIVSLEKNKFIVYKQS